MLKNSFYALLCCLIFISKAYAQQTTEQSGLKTTVTQFLSAQGPDSRRYEIAELGFNSVHWQSNGIVLIEIFNNYFSGGYEKYVLDQGSYTNFIPRLILVESYGSQHLSKITLGNVADLQTTFGGEVNRVLPIYLDLFHYAGVRVRFTYLQNLVTSVTNENQLAIHSNPSSVTIPNFIIPNVPDKDLATTGMLSVEGSGNHYIKGNLGVGIINPTEKLSVKGKIRAQEIKVESDPATWPDYVFEEGYKVGTLEELERYLKLHKHLPEIPSAEEVGKDGVSLGRMNMLLLKKIEELTLHMIGMKKELDLLKKQDR